MERSKNRSIDRHRKRPAANTSSLITAKRAGVLALVGLGLFGSYKLSESEPTEDFKRPVAEKTEKGQKRTHLPFSVNPESSEELEVLTRRKELFKKFIKEWIKFQNNKVDPTTHLKYLDELLREVDRVPLQTIKNASDRRKIRKTRRDLKSSLRRLIDWQENGHLNNEEWQEITDIIESFNEDELGEWAQGLNSYTYTLKPKLVTIEKIDFWLNHILRLTTISPSDEIGPEIGLVRKSEWESLLNMPTNSNEEAELKFLAARDLAQAAEERCGAFDCKPRINVNDWVLQ